jgi:hypothetical protein
VDNHPTAAHHCAAVVFFVQRLGYDGEKSNFTGVRLMPNLSRRPAPALFLAALTLGLPACSHPPREQTPVVRLEPADPKRMVKATEDGDYALYRVNETKSLESVKLKAGDDLGFYREGDYVIAVGGQQEKKLPNGSYVWKRQ